MVNWTRAHGHYRLSLMTYGRAEPEVRSKLKNFHLHGIIVVLEKLSYNNILINLKRLVFTGISNFNDDAAIQQSFSLIFPVQTSLWVKK